MRVCVCFFNIVLTFIYGCFAIDTDGFVIPSLGIGESNQSNPDAPKVEASKTPSPKVRYKCPFAYGTLSVSLCPNPTFVKG